MRAAGTQATLPGFYPGKYKTMTTIVAQSLKIVRLLPRAILLTIALAAPVLAVPVGRGDSGTTIEAPALKKMGAGFVLLVSLQRG
jgi:hypothetical protein